VRKKGAIIRKPKLFHVYIMTNRPRSHVLYTGVTGDLSRRVFEHKKKLVPGFTSRYNLTRLAYYECFFFPDAAIDREKEIKGWRRNKKIRLIESMNPHWDDLAERWGDVYKPPVPSGPREIPRPAGENAGLRDDASE
jgi:putative endonuclease